MPFWAVATLVSDSEAPLDFQVSLEDMVSSTGRLVEGALSQYSAKGTPFIEGDVLFGKLRPYLAKHWLADREGTAGGDIHVYRPEADVEPRYLAYIVGSRNFVRFAEAASKGVKMPRAEWMSLREYPVIPHDLGTQRAIADYLDRETGEIDAMIAKMDELAETLEVRRLRAIDTILAAHPRHRLRLVIELSQTGPFGTQLLASEYISGGVPLINPTHINRAGISPDGEVSVSVEKAAELSRHLLRPGDIVLGRKGEVDKAALVPEDFPRALCGSDSMLIRADDSVSMPRLLWWFFQSPYCHQQLERMSVGVSVAGLNQVAISQLWMPLPERPDQPKVVADLDEVTGKIDAMQAKVAELKSLLIERRAALITDVVTGRKAVA